MTVVKPEYHSGDLTAACPKNIELRWEGKFNPEMQTAMYRGSFASYLMEHLHRGADWSEQAVANAGKKAIESINADIKKEGRQLSETVEHDANEIHKEVLWVVFEYARRLGPFFEQCSFIGCEVPCRVTMELNADRSFDFASHLDLIFRAPHRVLEHFFPHLNLPGDGNRLCIWDFKFVKDSPTWDYLARQPQLLLYTVCAWQGSFLLSDLWIEFNQWPLIAWCHLPYFKPFSRKTMTDDDQGVATEYVKGDVRPLKAVVRWLDYRQDRLPDIIQELCQRPLMYEQGIFPMIPSPIGCHLCESRAWCPRFDMAQLDNKETP